MPLQQLHVDSDAFPAAVGNGEALLGYTRLPEAMDLTREIDIYWNDRLLSTILNPT